MPQKVQKKRRFPLLVAVLICVAVVSVILLVRFGTSSGNESDSTGFPISVNGLAIKQIGLMGGQIAVAEDADFQLYNSSGTQRYSVDLNYAAPVFVTEGNRALIYDRGGNRMKICNRGGEVCSKDVDGLILTCGLGGGRPAVATLSDSSTSILTVYDSNLLEEVFVWKTSSYITRVDLSPSGRYVAVAVVNNDSGDIYSEVTVFDTKSTEPLFTNRYAGETILSLCFQNNSDVLVVTDRSISGITGRDQLAFQTEFDYGTLSELASAENGDTALILSKISDGKDYVILYDKDGNLIYEFPIDSNARGLALSNSTVFVLYEDKLQRFSSSGKDTVPEELEVQSNSIQVLAKGKKAYVLTSEEIQKF